MELRIPEHKFYVSNPTSDWYSCEVKDDDKIHKIEVIPPRSIRNFPKTFVNGPKLQHIYKLLPDQIERYNAKSSGAKLVLEPIILNLFGTFNGTFEDENNNTKKITACLWFNDIMGCGFCRSNKTNEIDLILVNVTPSSHQVSFIIYDTNNYKSVREMKGRVDIIEECYHIDIYGNNSRIILDMPKSKEEIPEKDFFFTGSYLAFYARGDNEIQMNISLKAFMNGFIKGSCKENAGNYEIIGFVFRETGRIFLIRFNLGSLDKPFYFDGTFSEDGSITITGSWKCESKYGEFFLSKSD